MKKIVIGIMSMVVILSTIAYSIMNKDSTSLKQKGLKIVAVVDFLAEDKTYPAFFSQSDAIRDIVAEIGKEDYSKPRVIFEIKGLAEAMFNQLPGDLILGQKLKDLLGNRFSASLGGQINVARGSTYLAAASLLSYGESFIFSGITEATTYLYLYDGDYSMLVNFSSSSEDDVVSGYGTIVYSDAFVEASNAQDVRSILQEIGVVGVTISLVE